MSPKGSRSSDSEPPRRVARRVDVAALAGVGTWHHYSRVVVGDERGLGAAAAGFRVAGSD